MQLAADALEKPRKETQIINIMHAVTNRLESDPFSRAPSSLRRRTSPINYVFRLDCFGKYI